MNEQKCEACGRGMGDTAETAKSSTTPSSAAGKSWDDLAREEELAKQMKVSAEMTFDEEWKLDQAGLDRQSIIPPVAVQAIKSTAHRYFELGRFFAEHRGLVK